MTKSNIAFTRMTCDRCGAVEEITAEPDRLYAWAHISVFHENASEVIAARGDGGPPHLCPSCVTMFLSWWAGPETIGRKRSPA